MQCPEPRTAAGEVDDSMDRASTRTTPVLGDRREVGDNVQVQSFKLRPSFGHKKVIRSRAREVEVRREDNGQVRDGMKGKEGADDVDQLSFEGVRDDWDCVNDAPPGRRYATKIS